MSVRFFGLNLLKLQLRIYQLLVTVNMASYDLCTNETCFRDVFFICFSGSPLKTDTRIIRTLWHVPLVSVSTGFHCMNKSLSIIPVEKADSFEVFSQLQFLTFIKL